jgi:hypothetical protein
LAFQQVGRGKLGVLWITRRVELNDDRAQPKPAEALSRAEEALAEREAVGLGYLKRSLDTALEAASNLGDQAKLEQLLTVIEALPPGHTSPGMRTLTARYGAHRALLRSERGAAEGFAAAARIYRDLGWPFELAKTLLGHARWQTAATATT